MNFSGDPQEIIFTAKDIIHIKGRLCLVAGRRDKNKD
jgi:hypothetical protein